jgi:hypothetical protein
MAVTNQQVWSAYADALLNQVTSGAFDAKKQTFSVAGQSLNVDLGNADSEIINANVFNLANSIPAAGGAYTAESSLISAYNSFLNWIQLDADINPNLQSQLNSAAAAVTENQTNFIKVQGETIQAWKTYQAINPNIAFSDYVRENYPVYGEAKSSLTGTVSRYEQLCNQAYGPDYQTIVAARAKTSFTNGAQDVTMANTYNMKVKFGSSAPAGSGPAVLPGQNPPPPTASLIETYAPGFTLSAFTTAYQEWQTASVNNKLEGWTIEIDSSSVATDWSKFGWSAGLQASFPVGDFFSVAIQGQASYQEEKFNLKASAFSFKVEYTGTGLFPVASNLWFDPSIIRNYGGKLRTGAPDFFNQASGSLARAPAQVLIGFEPKLTLSLSNTDYSTFQSQFQESATVAVKFGPFTIGSATESVYSDKSSMQFHSDSSTVTVDPVKSTLPMVLGVICADLGPA